MTSKAITERVQRDEARQWQPAEETAPSLIRQDQPLLARLIGSVGLGCALLGALILVLSLTGRLRPLGPIILGPGIGGFFAAVGLVGLLFHAARDADLQYRRTYAIAAYLALAIAVLVIATPIAGLAIEVRFLLYGFPLLAGALFFLLPTTRNETDPAWRKAGVSTLGLVGLVLAATGFVGGNVSENFLLPSGLVLCLLGLGYLWAFVGLRGTADDFGYRAALGIGIGGFLLLLIALGRATLPIWLHTAGQLPLVPSGLLLMGLGVLYLALALGLCSDNPLIVLTRRELSAFFYSPIAYFILFALTILAWWFFYEFLNVAIELSKPGRGFPLVEPIVRQYAFGLSPVILIVFIVPILTMRLLSEEQRTGTLEVLFTAPVNETTVVLSKFFAALIFLMIAWVPWGFFLVVLRVGGGQPFDYRPLLSFFIAMAFMGAGFLSMGLFFSSLTRNQIVSAVLTFMGMLLMLGFGIAKWQLERSSPDSAWVVVLNHISYLELWFESLGGKLMPRYLLFHLSAAVFWLFATIKVLEARKWS